MLRTLWSSFWTSRKFTFTHDEPHLFTASQWQSDLESIPALFVIYKVLMALFFWASYIANMAESSKLDLQYFFIYLTNQGLTILAISQFLDIALLLWQFKKARSHQILGQSMSSLHKVVWIFKVVSTVLAVIITLLYWTLLFDGNRSYFNIYVHGLNSVVAFLDLVIEAKPWRLQHFYPPLIYGLAYYLFSLIYYLADGVDQYGNPFIYDVLDWRYPGYCIALLFGALAVFLILYLTIYGLYRLRIFIYNECACGKKAQIDMDSFWVNDGEPQDNRTASTNQLVFTITD